MVDEKEKTGEEKDFEENEIQRESEEIPEYKQEDPSNQVQQSVESENIKNLEKTVSTEEPEKLEKTERVEKIYATGRRKEAVARVFLIPGGKGEIIVNNKPVDEFFPRETLRIIIRRPLVLTKTATIFNIKATVRGGGISGQAGALRHGISRALFKSDENLRLTLRKAGFLTRDSRVKERKKYGRKRARRSFQYTKR